MTANEFRQMALGFPAAIESAHMKHPDFRVEKKIFATLGYPNEAFGMVKLTPEQQQAFIKKAPGIFAPCAGTWGKRGATNVHLALVKQSTLRAALETAWRNCTAKAKKSGN